MRWRMRIAVAATAMLASSAANALTVDELVAKNIAARGGAENLKALHSLRVEGVYASAGGGFDITAPIRFLMKRPDAMRFELSLQGLTQVQAFDGKEGWQIQPFGGRKEPDRMPEEDVKGFADDAEFDGPLVDWKAKGHKLEYLGTEDVDGTEAHKLKVTRANGNIEYHYLDPDHFLAIRVVTLRYVRGVESESETDLGNYEKVNGVYLPMSAAFGPKGSATKDRITYEKVEANVDLDDALFRFPNSK